MSFADDFSVIEVTLIKKIEKDGSLVDVNSNDDEKFIWSDENCESNFQEIRHAVVWKARVKTGVVISMICLIVSLYKAFGGG